MKRELLFITICVFCATLSAQTDTAVQKIMESAIAHFENGGVEMEVNVQYEDMNFPASIKMDKERFFINEEESSIWFDGKTQWTLREVDSTTNEKELYIGEPSEEELFSINPYLLMKNYDNLFFASSSKDAKLPQGAVSCIKLMSRNAKADIQDAYIFLDRENHLVALTTSLSNVQIAISVHSFKNGLRLKDSDFVCKVKDYDADIIDMR